MKTTWSDIPNDLSLLDDYLDQRESKHPLKAGAEAQIIWDVNSEARQTEYALVYLHGFKASHPEGHPVHQTIAKKFGCNLFLSRLAEHGIESEYPLIKLTEDKLLESARFALEIGMRIGKKVILMGTSTGGSLALYLAAQQEFKEQIISLILYSPLIRFYGIKEKFLMTDFGRTCLRIFPGKKYLIKTPTSTYAEDRIWYKNYTLQGGLALGEFIQHYMHKKLFASVNCPVFAGYYYKNKHAQDKVVSIHSIKRMMKSLGSRTRNLKLVNFPEAKSHVICSSLVSKSTESVIEQTESFLKDVGSHTTREH